MTLVAAAALSLPLLGVATASDPSHTFPGGCRLQMSSIANPGPANPRLWASAVTNLVGQPHAYWLIPHGCAWLYYPAETPAQRSAPSPGATAIPELRFKIAGRVHSSRIPAPARAIGLEGRDTWDFQTFTVAWPYVRFAACEYDGTQQTQFNGTEPIYAHYTLWTYNARGIGHWDAVTDDSHPCP
jgi:hypothetical protein